MNSAKLGIKTGEVHMILVNIHMSGTFACVSIKTPISSWFCNYMEKEEIHANWWKTSCNVWPISKLGSIRVNIFKKNNPLFPSNFKCYAIC
ncbi:hypothetical protein GYH30_016027 [Glycine max]|uniref:Uncharacterized protein n=1 Tax=Glycine max TaxID=3847 RepID=K7KWW1_SOYBN|nr:hypothetical protein GYH30_016027 [Glycine max]